MNNRTCPGVIPPYILRRIIDHGSELQQRCARQTLTHVRPLMAHSHGKPAVPHAAAPASSPVISTMRSRKRRCRANRCVMKASFLTAISPWTKPGNTSALRTISSG